MEPNTLIITDTLSDKLFQIVFDENKQLRKELQAIEHSIQNNNNNNMTQLLRIAFTKLVNI